MSFDLNALIHRLERAQARQNDRFNLASGGQSLPVGGGFAHFRGVGHPLNQALGLVEPISEDALAEVEAFLGAPAVLELSPGADESLWPLLASRGYRVHQFQQQHTRALDALEAPDPRFEIRPVLPRFRGRGVQKALIRARLLAAKELGCDIATASTLPSTPSQRAYEACGFRVAYPKVEMARDA